MTGDRLGYRELLDFERSVSPTAHPNSKARAVRVAFGISLARYYAALDRVILDPEAQRYAPEITGRLLRMRAARRALRHAGRIGDEPANEPIPVRQTALDLHLSA